VNKFAVRKMPI